MNQTDPDVVITSGPNDFTVTRTFHAPRELVFATLTTPEHLTHFWGPTGMSTPLDRIVIEPWVGGRFEWTMVNDESGEEMALTAVYEEVVAPERLVWRVTSGLGILNTSTFEDLGDGTTRVIVHQEDLPDGMVSEEMFAGFSSSLDKCEAYLQTIK